MNCPFLIITLMDTRHQGSTLVFLSKHIFHPRTSFVEEIKHALIGEVR